MNFTKLQIGISCDCLKDAHTDIETPYLRRIFNNVPNIDDFISWHDMGKKSKEDCEDICGFRGVSIFNCSQETLDNVVLKQKKAVTNRKKISPMSNIPEFGYIFTLKQTAGKIKQSGKDKTHYDLYKCDEFTLECLTEIQVINLADV